MCRDGSMPSWEVGYVGSIESSSLRWVISFANTPRVAVRRSVGHGGILNRGS
jgi:hypothetical protein